MVGNKNLGVRNSSNNPILFLLKLSINIDELLLLPLLNLVQVASPSGLYTDHFNDGKGRLSNPSKTGKELPFAIIKVLVNVSLEVTRSLAAPLTL